MDPAFCYFDRYVGSYFANIEHANDVAKVDVLSGDIHIIYILIHLPLSVCLQSYLEATSLDVVNFPRTIFSNDTIYFKVVGIFCWGASMLCL